MYAGEFQRGYDLALGDRKNGGIWSDQGHPQPSNDPLIQAARRCAPLPAKPSKNSVRVRLFAPDLGVTVGDRTKGTLTAGRFRNDIVARPDQDIELPVGDTEIAVDVGNGKFKIRCRVPARHDLLLRLNIWNPLKGARQRPLAEVADGRVPCAFHDDRLLFVQQRD